MQIGKLVAELKILFWLTLYFIPNLIRLKGTFYSATRHWSYNYFFHNIDIGTANAG